MTDTSTTNPFETFTALGYTRLVPVVPPDAELSPNSSLAKRKDARGKAVGVKGRDGLWRGLDWIHHEADEHDIDRWGRMGAGVGIKTGAGLLAIDADTLDADHARTIRDIIENHFGRLPVRIGRYPKALYVIRCSEPYRYTRVEFGETERVEVLSDGRQFVAHGIHPVTRNPYDWPRGITPLDEIPTATAAEIDAALEEMRQQLPAAKPIAREGTPSDQTLINPESLRGDIEHVRAAVAATPNTSEHFGSREEYLALGYAIKAALPDNEPEAFDIFADWCARWTDGENDPDIIAADWRRMVPPFRRGAGYIYDLAETTGSFSKAQLWFQPPEDTGPIFDIPSTPPKKFTFTHFNDAAAAALEEVSRPLIDGLLELSAMSVLYGDSNVGKTFVALGMAHSIATGQPYGGLPTTHGRVAYIAAEGGRGIRKRIAALKATQPTTGADPDFFLLVSPVDLRRPDADLKPLIEALTDLDPALVVLDTLSRVMAGGDENSSVDMGALVKHFDALRAATNAHLMVIHHTGKDKAKGARGHSLLRAATDTEIEVSEGLIAVTKQRDLEKDWQSGFRLESVVLGVDASDRPVSSARAVLGPVVDGGHGAAGEDASGAADAEKEGRLLEVLAASEWRADHRTGDAWAGLAVAMVYGLDRDDAGHKRQIKDILSRLKRSGRIREVVKKDAKRMPKAFVEVVLADTVSGGVFD